MKSFNFSSSLAFKLLALGVLCIIIFVFLPSYSNGKTSKREILVINSYHESDEWVKAINKGMMDCFQQGNIPVKVVPFFLDAIHHSAAQNRSLLKQILDTNSNARLIVSFDDEAANLLLQSKHPLLSSHPIVFSGLRFLEKQNSGQYSQTVGIKYSDDVSRLLNISKTFFPNRQRVYYVTDTSQIAKYETANFMKMWTTWTQMNPRHSLEIINVDAMPINSMLNLFRRNRTDAYIVMGRWTSLEGNLSDIISIPVFETGACSSLAISRGLGGYIRDPYQQGYDAASLALNLLKSPVEHSSMKERKIPLSFDWRELHKWNINLNLLPEDAIINNQPFWSKYANFLVIFSLLVLAIIVTFCLQIHHYHIKRRKEDDDQRKIQELKERQHELEITSIQHNEGTISLDLNFRVISINNNALQMLMLKKQEFVIGKRITDIMQFYDPDKKLQVNWNYFIHHTDQELCPIPKRFFAYNEETKAYFSVKGEVVRVMVQNMHVGYRVTFQNNNEEERQQTFLNMALEINKIYWWEYDVNREIFTFSKNFLQQLGIVGNDKTEFSFEDFAELIHPDDVENIRKIATSVVSESKSHYSLAFRLYSHKKTNYEWWEFRSRVVEGVNYPTPYKIFGICLSVQATKEAEQRLKQTMEKVLESDKLKSAFISNISHELRTPMNAIIGFSQLLYDYKLYDDVEMHSYIDNIMSNAYSLMNSLEQAIDISKIESGAMKLTDSCCNSISLLKTAVSTQRNNLKETVELVIDTSYSISHELVVDINLFTKVMSHLIENAIKFTSNGTITLGCMDNGDELKFFVKDTGIGISEADKPHIFERFYKGNPFVPGTGLGLSFCHLALEHYNAYITFESEENKGSLFWIHFPKDNQKRDNLIS